MKYDIVSKSSEGSKSRRGQWHRHFVIHKRFRVGVKQEVRVVFDFVERKRVRLSGKSAWVYRLSEVEGVSTSDIIYWQHRQ